MHRIAMAFAALILFALSPISASAKCWKTKSGEYLPATSRSTPPIKGARLVKCPEERLSLPKPTPIKLQPKIGVDAIILGDYSGECVQYARERVPGLPTGLFTWQDKLNIVRSHTPAPGKVAIIREGQVGHVAVVESVRGSQLVITEANFPKGKKRKRTSTGTTLEEAEKRLKIVGYWP